MRTLTLIIAFLVLAGCNDDEISYLSVRNETPQPFYAVFYTAGLSEGEWVQPGSTDNFFSLNLDHVNSFEYFSFYYDSVIVYLKEDENRPIKFYKDGSTVNYNPELNPFINSEVWHTRHFVRHQPGSSLESLEEKQIYEDYFSIETEWIISLKSTEPGN